MVGRRSFINGGKGIERDGRPGVHRVVIICIARQFGVGCIEWSGKGPEMGS